MSTGKLQIEAVAKRLSGASFYIPPYGALQVTVGDVFDQSPILLRGLILGSDGVLRKWGLSVDPPTRSLSSTLHNAPEGWVLSMSARVESEVMSGSEAFCRVQVLETFDSGSSVSGTILSGYCETGGELCFPNGRFMDGMVSNLAGYSIGLSNPAAGADLSEAFDNLAAKQLRGFCCRLVTDANAATRTLVVTITDQQGGIWSCLPDGTQAASLTRDYTFSPSSFGPGVIGTRIGGTFPSLALQGGWTLATAIANKQAADQLSKISVNGEFYLGSVL